MWFLMFPIAIAVSGMLLQVNVGALIQDSLKQSRGETVDIVNRMLTQKVDQLDNKIEKFQDGLNAQIFIAKDLDKRLTLVERDVEEIKKR